MVATRGDGWRLAPSLIALMEEVDKKWPNRSRASDGSIGDAAHSARPSEHNPDRDNDPMPRGIVSAVDITKNSAAMMEIVRKALVGDDRVWYVIHDGFIWSRTNNWVKKPYNGSNPHRQHLHVSLRQTAAAASDTSSWGIATASKPTPKPAPVEDKPTPTPQPADDNDTTYEKLSSGVKPGKRHAQVKDLQRLLIKAGYGPIRGSVTNYYGTNTREAVARFHRKNPQFASGPNDGVIGPKGYRELQREADNS